MSNASEVQSPRSVCQDAEFLQLDSPRSSSPQTTQAPVSKARLFCQKAFADCDLDNLEDEMADVTKDLEALRSSMVASKRSIYLLNFDDK